MRCTLAPCGDYSVTGLVDGGLVARREGAVGVERARHHKRRSVGHGLVHAAVPDDVDGCALAFEREAIALGGVDGEHLAAHVAADFGCLAGHALGLIKKALDGEGPFGALVLGWALGDELGRRERVVRLHRACADGDHASAKGGGQGAVVANGEGLLAGGVLGLDLKERGRTLACERICHNRARYLHLFATVIARDHVGDGKRARRAARAGNGHDHKHRHHDDAAHNHQAAFC